MSQYPLELILVRQLATHLATPAFLADPAGTVVFYNEAAGALLGRPHEEAGELSLAAWHALLEPADGRAGSVDQRPLAVALEGRRPVQGRFRLRGLDGRVSDVTVVAVPLDGYQSRPLGAVALVWELDER